jgi:hypothetical protein
MAGRSSKKAQAQPQAKSFDEFPDDVEGFEDDVPGVDAKEGAHSSLRSRDWRDVEKYREMRELKKMIEDDPIDFFSDRPGRRRR